MPHFSGEGNWDHVMEAPFNRFIWTAEEKIIVIYGSKTPEKMFIRNWADMVEMDQSILQCQKYPANLFKTFEPIHSGIHVGWCSVRLFSTEDHTTKMILGHLLQLFCLPTQQQEEYLIIDFLCKLANAHCPQIQVHLQAWHQPIPWLHAFLHRAESVYPQVLDNIYSIWKSITLS